MYKPIVVEKKRLFSVGKKEEEKAGLFLGDTVLHNSIQSKQPKENEYNVPEKELSPFDSAPEPPKPIVYKDKKTNEVLYGYSQHNLDSLIKLLHFVIILLGAFSMVIFFIIVYIFYIFQKYHVLTQIVNNLK